MVPFTEVVKTREVILKLVFGVHKKGHIWNCHFILGHGSELHQQDANSFSTQVLQDIQNTGQ